LGFLPFGIYLILQKLIFGRVVVDQKFVECGIGVILPQVAVFSELFDKLLSLLVNIFEVHTNQAEHLFELKIVPQFLKKVRWLGFIESGDQKGVLEEIADPPIDGVNHRHFALVP
jgi:hypothetical protein